MSKFCSHPMLEPINYEFDPQQAAEVYTGDMLKIYVLLWKAAVATLAEGPVIRNHMIILEFISECFSLKAQWLEMIEPGWHHFLPQEILTQNKLFFHDDNLFMNEFVPQYDPGSLKATQKIEDILSNIPLGTPLTWTPALQEIVAPAFGYAELIEHMAKYRVGRPSTYASAIDSAMNNQLIGFNGEHLSVNSQKKYLLAAIEQQPPDLQLNSVFCVALENDLSIIEQEPQKAGEILNKYCQQFFQQTTGLSAWLDGLRIEGKCLSEIDEIKINNEKKIAEKVIIDPLVEIVTKENIRYATSHEELAWDDYIFKTTLGHIEFKGRLYTRKARPDDVEKNKIFEEHLRDYLSLIHFGFLGNLNFIENIVKVEFEIETDRTKGFLNIESLHVIYHEYPDMEINLEDAKADILRKN